jgi:hypothetical protein
MQGVLQIIRYMRKTAVEWLTEELWLTKKTKSNWKILENRAKEREKDQLGALYLTLLLNTPDIMKFDFEQWYNENTNK